MTARRIALLILGLAGSVLASAILYVSVEGSLAEENSLPVSGVPIGMDTISLPVPVLGTDLQAERLSSYEGPFLEDGSDREVVNVAALHVCNPSALEILKTYIYLQCGDVEYVFYGEHIPPGGTVVILEREGKSYQTGAVTGCTGWQETAERGPQTGITVTDRAMGTLVVTNSTNQTQYNVCLYYKSWLSPPDVYMGGITYMVHIPVLLPGQTEYLYPNHYATGYSRVVSVTAEP